MQGLATGKLLSSAASRGCDLDVFNVLQEGFDQIGFSSARPARHVNQLLTARVHDSIKYCPLIAVQ